jgi:hypothetical protein
MDLGPRPRSYREIGLQIALPLKTGGVANNDALYDPVPVKIRYSQRLARTIANVPDLPGSTYPYRLFM